MALLGSGINPLGHVLDVDLVGALALCFVAPSNGVIMSD